MLRFHAFINWKQKKTEQCNLVLFRCIAKVSCKYLIQFINCSFILMLREQPHIIYTGDFWVCVSNVVTTTDDITANFEAMIEGSLKWDDEEFDIFICFCSIVGWVWFILYCGVGSASMGGLVRMFFGIWFWIHFGNWWVDCLLWFGWVLGHINHFWLTNAKCSLYRYIVYDLLTFCW